ncbi:unnamed protein product [Phyllotreta striolata]|uniref:Uncharacterized protein n=1 Tax=Phyllotreta striolata TaxID=444603 RepID=A0A9N9TL41_PHYSR|nr:unnamed protein product [Phyllotreta striolata]
MLLVGLLLLQLAFIQSSSGDALVTFKNVVFHGYYKFAPKFKPTILSGDSLKDFLPSDDFDRIEIVNQNVPVLFENAICDIGNLEELIIESCNVRSVLPGAFRNLARLKRISLKVNVLSAIENGVFNHLLMHTLDLSYNRIEKIASGAFDDMPHIYHINLAHNKISEWDVNWFKRTPELSVIYFKNNELEELPGGCLRNLDSIRDVNLILSRNRISKINRDAFAGRKRINQLFLDNNLLRKFDKEILRDTFVNDLRLNNNSIECFVEQDLDTVFRGTNVYIEYNPLDCECREMLGKWSRKHDGKDLGINEDECFKGREDSLVLHWGRKPPYADITVVLPKSYTNYTIF